MKRTLSRAFLRVPECNPFWTKMFAGLGCVAVILGVVFYVLSGQDWGAAAGFWILGPMQLILVAFNGLPDHRRRAKGWLKVVILLYCLAPSR